MPDVREEKLWNERISQFKDFAHTVEAEFEMKILENGKEFVAVKQFYRPRKESRYGEETRSSDK